MIHISNYAIGFLAGEHEDLDEERNEARGGLACNPKEHLDNWLFAGRESINENREIVTYSDWSKSVFERQKTNLVSCPYCINKMKEKGL